MNDRADVFLNILVVEDHPINIQILEQQLIALGHKVVVVNNGHAAYQLLLEKENSFDLLITDINMPAMTGHDLVKKIRSEKIDIPVLGITADTLTEDIMNCAYSGMQGCLLKPFSIDMLKSAINSVFYSTPEFKSAPEAVNLIPAVLMDEFKKTMCEDYADLVLAWTEREYSTQMDVIHRMKGSFALSGNRNGLSICDKISKNIKNQDDQQLEFYISRLLSCVDMK